MPREPRIYIEKVLYFVTAKSLDNVELFQDSQDYTEYMKSLSELKHEFGFKLFSYCLLPKRLYLLIELQNGVSISTIMHHLNSNYTKKYNSRYGKKGHLFQSRFKSILVEKERYLLRMTRYIHLLPKKVGVIHNVASYPFSSFFTFTYEDHQSHAGMQWPNIVNEIMEVMNRFDEALTDTEKVKAYERYIESAKDGEIEDVEKLLHRTAYVGSDEFKAKIRERIESHRDESRPKIVRKPNPWILLSGSLVVLFLSAVSYYLYNNQTVLQATLDKTSSGFGVAREELTKRVNNLESTLVKYESTDELDGTAWEIRITPLGNSGLTDESTGQAFFMDGQVTIRNFAGRTFPAFAYTLTAGDNGRTVWKTANAKMNGSHVQIEGLWTGKTIKGLVRERPSEGMKKDFTFVSVRRVIDIRRANNAVQ